MHKIKLIITALSIITAAFTGFAQSDSIDVQTIDLQTIRDAARQSNPEVIKYRYDLLIAETAEKNAWSVFLPDVRLNTAIINNQAPWKEDPTLLPTNTTVPYIDYTNNLINKSVIDPDIDPWTGSIGASAQWIFTPALFSGLGLLGEQKGLAQLQLEISQKTAELQVIELFYNALNLQDQLTTLKKSIAYTEKRVNQSTISFQAGIITDIEMKQAELALYKLGTLQQQLETALFQIKTALSLSTGLPFSGNTVFITPDTDIKRVDESISDNSQLRFISMAIGAQRLKAANTFEQGLLPVIALSLDVNSALNGVFDSESYDDPSLHHTFNFTAALSIPVSAWIPGSQAHTAVEQEELKADQLEQQYTQLLLKLETDLKLLEREIAGAEKSIAENNASTSLSRDIYTGTEVSYLNGGATYLDVEEAQFNLLQKEQEGIALKYKRDILLYKMNALFY